MGKTPLLFFPYSHMKKQNIIVTRQLEQHLDHAIADIRPDRLFVLTDASTRQCCLPLVSHFNCMADAHHISIPAGEEYKTLNSAVHVWQELQHMGATRHSLVINLGGGMVCDLGSFAAATFKRGMHFINIPTTLLAMVDASAGGKTGINFEGLKNEIGVFRQADRVIVDTRFLKTLDQQNLLSGYAEMLKHGLISDRQTWAHLLADDILSDNWADMLGPQIAESIQIKQRLVSADPLEQGLRKALNFGHTAGHAFESFSMLSPSCKPVLHGYAVAYGMVVELYLSTIKSSFPVDAMRQTVRFIRENYGCLVITCNDYPTLLQLMTHDKKNTVGHINFTLLADIGDVRINQTATEDEIKEALDFYREA